MLKAKEAEWLIGHSFQGVPKQGACKKCGRTDVYEVIARDGGKMQVLYYATPLGDPVCRRCWKFIRFLDRFIDYGIRFPWVLLLRMYIFIEKKLRRTNATDIPIHSSREDRG